MEPTSRDLEPTATRYLEGLGATFTRIEITGRDGVALPLDDGIERAVGLILGTALNGRKVLLIGNGGSAAIVSHMHNDLCKAVGVRAMVFHELPLLTALTNDHGYECVFDRPIGLWADPLDTLIAVSSSGESPNILRGVKSAVDRGCRVLTMSGFQPTNRLRQLGELNIYVPAPSYGYVELTHTVLAHCVTDLAMAAMATMATARAVAGAP
jgi:D-sedoheptulose 7-phosphate isomerase